MLAGPPPEVWRLSALALHVDAVDDVEELLDHRDFLEDKLNFSIETLQKEKEI